MDSQTYCDDHLIRYLQMPGRSSPPTDLDEAVQPA
jgi:hypothetical protein